MRRMIDLSRYDYAISGELIAKEPAEPRDASRLFAYDTATDTVSFDVFRNIGNYLPQKSLLVMNDTKVVPARLWLTKETDGKIAVLLMMNEFRPGDAVVKGIVDRKVAIGAKLFFQSGAFLEIVRQDERFFFFKPSMTIPELFALLEREGVTPIPPYIKNAPLSETALREKYQSVFAKNAGAVAAPTASLHFTPELLVELAARGVKQTHVTLHVGMGTFAPIGEENFKSKKLFTEYYEISEGTAEALDDAKADGYTIIPVGTTACRALESSCKNRHCNTGSGATNIFIFPPYDFKIAGGLITNFHIPKSSLMLLVDAFLEHKKAKRNIQDLYKVAVENKFRFYSFGDAMLIV